MKVALLVYSVLLGIALLAPTSGDQSTMASWIAVGSVSQAQAEFLCNIAILAPVSALGSLIWRRTTWRDWTAYAFVLACAVELTQGIFLGERTASATDVVANTLGGLAGAVLVLAARKGRQELDRRARLDDH
ncbi:hypothetical protein GCM10009795_000550 [Nocardioides hankookensis]|uniref:VanZ family protein n=1 Tax=Nocardioides hankookensis TaxID=443157 RepID=A0ABW1LMH2_9ACTN